MMSYRIQSKNQVKKFAEVFTPAGCVFDMILQDGIRPLLKDVDKTILDPATGEGQFPCAELVWKLFFNHETLTEQKVLRALKSLYAIDIQPASIDLCKNHLRDTIKDAYKFFTGKDFTRWDDVEKILAENLIVGDSLKVMNDWINPQISLF